MRNTCPVIIFFFILLPIPSQAQDQSLERTLNWQDSRKYHQYLSPDDILSGEYMHFKEARYFDRQTLLPYYYEIIPLNRAEEYSVKLVNKKFEPVASESLLNETARDTLGDEIQVESRLRFDRNKPFIQLHFVPLKTNPATGNIEKLVEFSISLERKGVDMKSLRKSTDKKTESSLLAQGRWVKIRVKQNGIYKISYSKLKDLGFDHPENIGIYGNSCGLLNVSNDTTKDYRLQQIPVEFVKGSDGVFSKGDHVLFYARGPNVWNYDENKEMFVRNGHPYTEYGYYFIGGNPRSKNLISGLEAPAGDPAELITSFIDYTHHEERNRNLIESGQEWVGEYFDVKLSHDFDFEFPNIVADAPVRIKGDFVSRSSYESRFEVISGNQNIISVDIPSVNYDYTGYFARQKSGYGEYFPESDQVSLEVVYDKGTPSARGWLNYLTVNAHRQLKMKGNQMQFRYRSEEAPKVVEFELEQAPDNLEIWDVTSDRETRKIDDFERNGNTVRFKINADTVFREFIAFNHKEYPEPEILGEIENQNLQGLGPKDMLIVTKNRFTAEAKELADIHRETDDFKISVVTDEQIYNEFSSGKSDPSAIRNFVRMIYNKSIPGDSLKYLLLFGDGSYDNLKSCESPYLMTYQSKQSFNYSRSFVSDDFFGLLDPEDHIRDEPSGLIDIGIGRFPVKNREEARNVVDKVKRYLNPDNWGAWLSNLCFAADDQDNNLHMRDADKLTKYVNGSHPRFNIRKIYFDSYRQQNTATGSVYPEVNRDINENINNGILLFNYTGHGGENHLAHERVLTKDDIEKWKNPGKMPLFMTATCEFTRFDDPDYVSAGEEVFLKPDGGSIALFSTTRLVYASLNYDLNRTFYDYVFEKDQNGEPLRFGDIVRLTKNYTGTSNNKRNFSLIGDPALKMPLGEYGIHTDSIVANNSQRSDTLHALDKITVYGQVVDKKGKRAEHFNGSLNIKLFDKAVPKTTLGNDGGSAFTYQARNNILFSGESKVKAGTFRGEFIIPKTILPDLGKGKLMYFGKERSTLAQGHYSDFYVGGYTERKLNDSQGPDIEIYMNDRDFVSGGITDEDPLLLAKLKDSSGINVSSAGIGQDLVMVLDNDHQDKRVLNRYYNADQNSYQKGEVRYQMSGLEKGQHELMLKAWDINENSSTERIEFTVAESDRLQIRKLLNYPNPFTENTAFYFEHNHPATNLDMLIQIFTISGKLVKTIQRQIQTDGFRAGPIHWDGRDDFGDKIGKGVYLYKIKIRSDEGESAEKIQKLVILK